jgi:hypothetical protein
LIHTYIKLAEPAQAKAIMKIAKKFEGEPGLRVEKNYKKTYSPIC